MHLIEKKLKAQQAKDLINFMREEETDKPRPQQEAQLNARMTEFVQQAQLNTATSSKDSPPHLSSAREETQSQDEARKYCKELSGFQRDHACSH